MRPTDKQKKSLKPLAFSRRGFTLAELLVSLLILGEIATFTLPKILISQQNSRAKQEAKQIAATVSAIFINEYNSQGGESWISSVETDGYYGGLTIFLDTKLNYSKLMTDGEAMTYPPAGAGAVYAGARNCGGWVKCYQLHNGGVLWFAMLSYNWDGQFMQWFFFDPDSTGPMESVPFILMASRRSWLSDPSGNKYPPGRLMTFKELGHISWGAYGSANPSWFSWN